MYYIVNLNEIWNYKDSPLFLNPQSILGFHEFVGTRMFGFSRSSAVTTTLHTYPNFLNKGNDPLECSVKLVRFLSVFVDVGEILVMADDVATHSNF
jgi:hypothetical protein